MRLIFIGSEYAGKTTLAVTISQWMISTMALPFVRWHNHFVVPTLDQHLIVEAENRVAGRLPGKQVEDLSTKEDLEQVIGLRPTVLEQLQRHNVWRHLHPDMFQAGTDSLFIGFYYAEAVYAPLYYGYGGPGTFSDRRKRAREWDHHLLEAAPDVVLVMVKASSDAIRKRMRENPRSHCILKDEDVETVLTRFDVEYGDSLIHRRFVLDTTETSVDRTLEQLVRQIRPYLSKWDLLRMSTAS